MSPVTPEMWEVAGGFAMSFLEPMPLPNKHNERAGLLGMFASFTSWILGGPVGIMGATSAVCAVGSVCAQRRHGADTAHADMTEGKAPIIGVSFTGSNVQTIHPPTAYFYPPHEKLARAPHRQTTLDSTYTLCDDALETASCVGPCGCRLCHSECSECGVCRCECGEGYVCHCVASALQTERQQLESV